MMPMNTGKWLLHCHVNDHKRTGMETIFEVKHKFMWGKYELARWKMADRKTYLIKTYDHINAYTCKYLFIF